MNVKIIVAAHKQYWMPNDSLYLSLYVGSAGNPSIEGFQRDDAGAHISERNASFCELTGIYWAWKNLDADYIGLAHYRRYFARRFGFSKKGRIATRETIERALAKTDVILPKERQYYIETSYSHYAHAHHEQDLILTREILLEHCPDYLAAWERVMNRTHGHRFNIFVMKKELLNRYLDWLFDMLFTLETRLDISTYTGTDRRAFGYVSERLLDVWIEHNQIPYVELPVVNLENQHWLSKILNFLKRKFAYRNVE
ncbi:MAG: DUF4422 domain-containing protein [Clostridiaceae bacterium]